MIHGGPTGTSQPTLSPGEYAYPVQIFLAKGALVLEPNYRGSAGYGAAFRALNVRNLGVGDMWDVMSGVDSLIAKGIVDSEPNGLDGLVRGRIHLRVSDDAHGPLQGHFGRRGNQRLDDLLRQHGHHAVHPAVSARDSVGRPGDLRQDVADHDDQAGQDADV